jgi:hypothetical protein
MHILIVACATKIGQLWSFGKLGTHFFVTSDYFFKHNWRTWERTIVVFDVCLELLRETLNFGIGNKISNPPNAKYQMSTHIKCIILQMTTIYICQMTIQNIQSKRIQSKYLKLEFFQILWKTRNSEPGTGLSKFSDTPGKVNQGQESQTPHIFQMLTH